MNSFASLFNHPDISFSPIPDSIKVDNPATGETLAFVRTTSQFAGRGEWPWCTVPVQ